jgi:hypothetical protein
VADTEEGRALLKKIREDRQEQVLKDIAEADREQPDAK